MRDRVFEKMIYDALHSSLSMNRRQRKELKKGFDEERCDPPKANMLGMMFGFLDYLKEKSREEEI